jgi:hypothetical protein
MSTLNDKDRENLTAFLDGELDSKTARALEAKINLDPEARKEVEALKQAWGMLDYLPRAQPSLTFTSRTLERLSKEKMGQVLEAGNIDRQRTFFWLHALSWTAALFIVAGAGMLLGQVLFPRIQNVVEADPLPISNVKLVNAPEWVDDQPKKVRDQYALLPEEAKKGFVAKARLEEHQRRQEWLIAGRFWNKLDKGEPLPARLADFSPDVRLYYNEILRPLLSKEEDGRLEKAQGQWPLYPLILVELADKHPPALRGPKGPKTFAELPAETRKKFLVAKTNAYPPKLVKSEGRWPDFAITLTSFIAAAKKGYALPKDFWPWDHTCLSPPMLDFVDKKLKRALDNDEKLTLINAEGRWPEYPTTIQKLADKHHLTVPWLTLPVRREQWDVYRLPPFEER